MKRSATKPRASTFGLRDRLIRTPTIVAFTFTALLIVGLIRAASAADLEKVAASISTARPAYLLAALFMCLLTITLRGLRWRSLLRAVSLQISSRAAIEILTLSFWVNVILPAKVGDLYRAWLLKQNDGPSFGRGVGTVVLERALDLITVALLGAASAYVAFAGAPPAPVVLLALLALALALIGIGGLLFARGPATSLIKRLPLPARVAEPITRAMDALREGSTRAGIAAVVPYTLTIWALQGFRLGFVAAALGLFQVNPGVGAIGLSAVLFTALISAVLSTIPFTPAGLGVVEAGSVGVLVGIFGVAPESAIALMLLDRVIDIGSLLIGGGLLFTLSPYRRGAGKLN